MSKCDGTRGGSRQREGVTEPTLDVERGEPEWVADTKAMEMVVHEPPVERPVESTKTTVPPRGASSDRVAVSRTRVLLSLDTISGSELN